MKKISIILVSMLSLGGLAFLLLSNKTHTEVVEKKPYVLSMTKSIDVPQKINFAGEEIDLSRYDMHERFDREINGFSYLHSTTLLYLKKANRYFPVIEPILKANGVPEDFKYLAVIESNLNHRAVSPAKAAGLWQFMPRTAQEFGLVVGAEVDERYSVERSTEAACRYLKQAYNRYGNWADVALSYNAGQGRISGELEKQQVDGGLDLWLVEETSRYYFRILAIKQLMENPYKYGYVLDSSQFYKPMEFKKVKVDKTILDLASFAQEQGITYAQLKDFNSWLSTRKLTVKAGESYIILIPTKKSLYYKDDEKVKIHDKNWISH